jgi:octaprenyl-diphosphate synthase
MDNLAPITKTIQKEIELFQTSFSRALDGHNPDFQGILDYIAKTEGKRIRPVILFLSAQLCGIINQKTIDYAVILELLHTATLIHDDVVDNASERRGKASINARFDNRSAVLTGDYILSLAIIQGINTQNFEVLDIMGNLARNLIDGELTQMASSQASIVSESRYFDVIRKKTAILLSSCTQLGAISVSASRENTICLRTIGENLGVCFQIRDDIFDYFDQGEIGKPTGNDIREGKVTLPLIYALNTAPAEIAQPLLSIIENQDFTADNILKLTNFAKEYRGIDYAYSYMEKIKAKILLLLDQFPDSETKNALINLTDYIIERKK